MIDHTDCFRQKIFHTLFYNIMAKFQLNQEKLIKQFEIAIENAENF